MLDGAFLCLFRKLDQILNIFRVSGYQAILDVVGTFGNCLILQNEFIISEMLLTVHPNFILACLKLLGLAALTPASAATVTRPTRQTFISQGVTVDFSSCP